MSSSALKIGGGDAAAAAAVAVVAASARRRRRGRGGGVSGGTTTSSSRSRSRSSNNGAKRGGKMFLEASSPTSVAFYPHRRQQQQQQQHGARSSSSSRLPTTTTTTTFAVSSSSSGKTTTEPDAIVSVKLDQNRDYPIYIGSELMSERGDLLRKHIKGDTVLIVTNETIAPLYLDKVKESLSSSSSSSSSSSPSTTKELRIESVILPDGEEYKNLDVLDLIFEKALESRLDRKTTFIALGGGVIGDMTGFAASAYQRGVNFIQIPTTVMAMVDSSVGGKTGVNHKKGKNMIGAFYQPQCVFVDIDSLNSLPVREYNSGIAEVIKYGLIRDAKFFDWIEQNADKLQKKAIDRKSLVYAIQRSCENKAEVVELDEKESGLNVRATLNLGHTFGHAIETGVGYGEYLHGEAVSIGTAMAADLSYRLGWIDEKLQARTVDLLKRFDLPIEVPEGSMTKQKFMDLMAVDKKASQGKMNFILLKGDLGGCVFTGDFDQTKLQETLESFVR
jgi:3-dehydroquinate synthase